MKNFVLEIIDSHGIPFSVIRNGAQHKEKGAPNSFGGEKVFCFKPSADVKKGDILSNPAGDIYYVSGAETEYDGCEAAYIKASYTTQPQIQKAENQSTVFNIQNAYGSIIGNNNQGTLNYNAQIDSLKSRVEEEQSGDKEEMKKIISLLELIVSDKVPPSKGLFSKFSAVMERHSWLSSSVAGTILSWLLTQIPH